MRLVLLRRCKSYVFISVCRNTGKILLIYNLSRYETHCQPSFFIELLFLLFSYDSEGFMSFMRILPSHPLKQLISMIL